MTTPTIEEMNATFTAAWDADIDRQGGGEGADHDAIVRAAWFAVIEKHIGPMILAAAHANPIFPDDYAARIIEQMKEKP